MERQPSMKQLPSLSPSEWEALLDDFASGVPSRRARWLTLPLLDLALHSLLLRRDFPTALKPLLLLFLEDSSPLIASTPSAALPPLLDSLRSLLLLPSSVAASDVAPSTALREQFMTTVTSVTISALDSPLNQSSASHVELLVELLLGVVNRPNYGPDRHTRAVACECLRELESAFPCLLVDTTGHLWAIAQAERTHVSQSYLLLLASVVHNVVLYGLLCSPISIFSTSVPLVPFNIPNCIFSVSLDHRSRASWVPSDLNLREIKRVMAFLWERPQAFTPPATMELVSILTSIASALEQHVPAVGSLLKVQFSCLIYSYDPILCHVVLMLCSRFPDTFAGEDERSISRRLVLVAKEVHQPLVFRLLAIHWLLGSPRLGKGKDSLALLAPSFYPAVFDPLALKAKKLDAMACIAASLDASEVGRTGDVNKVHEKQRVKLLEDGLVCVSAFKWLPSWSTETSVAFHTLHKFLIGVFTHGGDSTEKSDCAPLTDSIIFGRLKSMMVHLASEHRVLVPVIATFIDRLLGCKAHCRVGELLLQELDEHLLPKLELDYHMGSYFPIFERIAKNDTIPPCGLLDLLTRHIVSLVKKHGPDTRLRSWSQGTKVLGICRMMLKYHHSSRVFLPLSRLLAVTCQLFPDLEVRDSARIYLRTLVCIPGKKLRQILELGEQPSGVSASPPGSLFQVPSPRHSDNVKKSGSVSSYIFIERVIPLLAKHSWALALPKSSNENSGKASNFVGVSDIKLSASTEMEGEGEVNFERISSPKDPLRVIDSNVAEILGILRRHFSCIPDYRHMPAIKIMMPCTLRFDSESFNYVWGYDSSSSGSEEMTGLPALYATTLSFSSTSNYGSIPPCRVPFLLGEPPKDKYGIVPADGNYEEDTTYRATITIELEPREPMPGLIDVTITANAENGQVISGRLESIAVGIEDMFLKASIPHGIKEDEVPEYYINLFHALWEACSNSANTGRETFPLSGGQGVAAINGIQSVKLLEIFQNSVIDAVEKYLSSFVVGVVGDPLVNTVRNNGVIRDIVWEDDSDDFVADNVDALVPYSENLPLQLPYLEDDDYTEHLRSINKRQMGIFLVLVFLPPRFHLLFQIEVGNSSTLVRIRTDHWPCLAYVDEYLECLFLT